MNKFPVLLLAFPFLFGCASYPEDVAPSYVSSLDYDGLTCDALEKSYDETESRLEILWKEQKQEADSDIGWLIGGALLFPPAMLAAIDSHVGEELARAKGAKEAIVYIAAKKGCDDFIRKTAAQ